MDAFYAHLTKAVVDVEAALDRVLPKPEGPEARLHEAMRYAALGGGKRLRPFLTLHSAGLFGVDPDAAALAAAAVECVHCYSLIHDDLPAMDDDDLRHGKPTTHLEFDEATAILAGDALLTLAFETLSDPAVHEDARVRLQAVRRLAGAAGVHGMVGGQMIDIEAEKQDGGFDRETITRLQQLKTGALIVASCDIGAILGKADPAHSQALHAYGHDLGLAFQIADDLLDADGDEQAVGKRIGKDEKAGKATFLSLLGPDQARVQADLLRDQAIAHLDPFGPEADGLRSAARFVVSRNH